jgi:hypothetical protein
MVRGDELRAYIEGLERPVAGGGRAAPAAAASPYARLA